MRVSTAALYTLAALVAHDLTSPAMSAPADDTALPDQPSTITPADKGLTTSELVTPIAPVEAFAIELAPVATIPVIEKAAPAEVAVPVHVPEAAEVSPTANLVPSAAPLTMQSVPTATANSAPVFSSAPDVTSAVERASTPQSTPLIQTLNEEALLPQTSQASNSRLSAQQTISVETLTIGEIKAFQQGLTTDRAKTATVANSSDATTENTTATPAALVSANLAEAATAAFGNQPTQPNPTAVNSVANSQPSPDNLSGHDDNNGFSLSVQTPSNNARSYYNLTTRPPAQLSNGNVSLLFPLSLPSAITSAFGWRIHPVLGSARFHAGTDLGAPQGTPVLAALDGKVEIADFVGGYGLTIVLQHTKGTEQTLYAHLSEIFVQPGDTIKQGEAIGRVGSTGLSTGPHLHFEFRKLTQEGWTVMDPGPALEYALLNFNPSQQVAQADSVAKLPSFFKYSGKFLDTLSIAAQDNKTQQETAATGQTQPTNSQFQIPQLSFTTITDSLAEARTNLSVIQLPRPQ